MATVNDPEKYDNENLTEVQRFSFQEVNMSSQTSKVYISINGKEIKVKFFLMSSATADYSCLWDKIYKERRWDTNKPSDHYDKEALKRELQENKGLCHCSKDNYGCIN